MSARLGLLPGVLFSSPTTVARTLVASIVGGEMPRHLLATLGRMIPGLILGAGPVGEASRIAVASVAAFYPMLINTMAGVREINPIYFEVARNYGASRRKLLTRVVLPGSLPLALSDLRLAANVTLLVTIAAEIVMAETGLGSLGWLAWETLRVELLHTTLIVVSALGIGISTGLHAMRRARVPWQTEAKRA